MRARSARSSFAVVVAGMLAVAVAASPAIATFPGGNGDIAYLKIGGSSLAMRAIAPDGTGDHQLSVGASDAVDAEYTPDGTSAVIAESGHRRGRIVLLDLATSDRTVILGRRDAPGQPFSLGVSPDGGSVAFCVFARRGYRLYTVDVDGSNLTRISFGTDDCHADWGSNNRIVASEEIQSGAQQVVTMAPDGSDREVVETMPPPEARWNVIWFVVPNWAPDASRIVFGAQRNRVYSDIFAIDPDGANLSNLTGTRRRSEYGPLFSPDGALVAFTREQPMRRGPDAGDLWLMDADGANVTRITDTERRDEYSRSWQAIVP